MVITGPMFCAGNELATAATQALGVETQFENISQAEAQRVLKAQSESGSQSWNNMLEYCSLVSEGKTSYISTTAFHDVTGEHKTDPLNFIKMYASHLKPSGNKRAKKSHQRLELTRQGLMVDALTHLIIGHPDDHRCQLTEALVKSVRSVISKYSVNAAIITF